MLHVYQIFSIKGTTTIPQESSSPTGFSAAGSPPAKVMAAASYERNLKLLR